MNFNYFWYPPILIHIHSSPPPPPSDRVSLCSSDCPGNPYIDDVWLIPKDLPAPTSQVLIFLRNLVCICFISLSVLSVLPKLALILGHLLPLPSACLDHRYELPIIPERQKNLMCKYLQNNICKWHILLVLIVISFWKQNTYMNEQVVPCIFCSYFKVNGGVPRGSSSECDLCSVLQFLCCAVL